MMSVEPANFLQAAMEIHPLEMPEIVQSWPFWEIKEDRKRQVKWEAETVTPLLHAFSEFSKAMVIFLYCSLLILFLAWFLCGLPRKAPLDESVKDGCPRAWVIFLCSTYGFISFSTDQYIPSIPQMGVDLDGSQSLMSGSVQLNFITKSAVGLLTAGISDYVGRRPVMVGCLCLLALSTFCCGCAPNINWFLASRFLQGLGESTEPVVYAVCRDYFPKPEERLMIVGYIQLIGITGQIVAPIFGGLCMMSLNWRASFFVVALIWGAFAAYAARNMVESCPDVNGGSAKSSYLRDLRKVFAPGSFCLLLTEMCVITPFQAFNANIGYVAEVSYGQSMVITVLILLGWAIADSLGVFLGIVGSVDVPVLRVSRTLMALVAATGVISLALGTFGEYLWAFLTASTLQSLLLAATLVPLSVLYFQNLDGCAGLAASTEICLKYVPTTLYSMICTQSLIHSGVKSYMNLQSASYVVAPLFYLCYEIFRLLQPDAGVDETASNSAKDRAQESVLDGDSAGSSGSPYHSRAASNSLNE